MRPKWLRLRRGASGLEGSPLRRTPPPGQGAGRAGKQADGARGGRDGATAGARYHVWWRLGVVYSAPLPRKRSLVCLSHSWWHGKAAPSRQRAGHRAAASGAGRAVGAPPFRNGGTPSNGREAALW
jgi:hypothetical protein